MPVTPRRRIDPAAGAVAAAQVGGVLAAGGAPDRPELAMAVRFLLEELAAQAPGNSVEVRVPPYGVTQCVAGPRHTRGTPPNVVETDPITWVRLALGQLSWQEALREYAVRASGERSDLEAYLPLRAP